MAPSPSDLPSERTGHSAPPDLATRREALQAAVAAGIWRTDPAGVEERVGGIRCLRFAPSGPSRATILHLHGGAFRIGSPEQMAPFAVALAARCQVSLLCPAYRLAPEHPFPAGLNDAYRVYATLRGEGDERIILSGDSAGGGLAASTTALAVRDGIAPLGLILLSPWLDLRVTADSYADNAATDPLFSRESATQAAELYLQGGAPSHPSASPLLGALVGFPPTLILTGDGEVLKDDALAFQAGLERAGVPAELDLVPGMEHVAVTRDRQLVGADQSFSAVAHFVAGLLDYALVP